MTSRGRDVTMYTSRGTAAPGRRASLRKLPPGPLVPALFALIVLLALASGCGTQGTSASGSATTPSVSPAPSFRQERAHVVPAPAITTAVQAARRQLYLFSTSDVGLMQPGVDAHGNVWAGEMNTNRLGRLNAQTGVVSSWTPPGAQYGIMTTIVDAQGNAWFAEQNANYIGRFDPRQQAFRLFPLGTWKGNPLGPQDLHFDGEGRLWFTAALAGAIGRLDPTTGAIRIWPVPSPAPTVPSSPYCLTVAPSGLVWFGDYAGGAFGSLDPASGQVTLYDLPDPQSQVFAMATDAAGRLWFTEILPGKLGLFDPATGDLTELTMPAAAGTSPALYGLVIDHQGNIWFVDVGADTLVRYVPEKRSMTFFQLSIPSAAPSGLTLDPAGNLWFTAGGAPDDYAGEMTP